jgi:hypothetical protein
VKKVIYSDSSQIVGDEVAAVLLEFAAALAGAGAAEPVTFRAVGSHGGTEDASFLLGPASQIAVEATDGGEEPDNSAAIAHMRGRIAELRSGGRPQAEPPRRQEIDLDEYEYES